MKTANAAKMFCPFMTSHVSKVLNDTAFCITTSCMAWVSVKLSDPELRHADGTLVDEDEGDCALMGRKRSYYRLHEERSR